MHAAFPVRDALVRGRADLSRELGLGETEIGSGAFHVRGQNRGGSANWAFRGHAATLPSMSANCNSVSDSAIDIRAQALRLQVMASETAKRVGARIKQARAELGLNQRQFAALFAAEHAVSNQHISNWERAVNEPSDRYMQELVRITGKELAWFYTDPTADRPADLMGAFEGKRHQLDRIEGKLDAVVEALEALASGQLEAALLAAAQTTRSQQPRPGSERASTGHRRGAS